MSLEHLRDIVAPLQVHATALAALEAALTARMCGVPLNIPFTLEAIPSSDLMPLMAEIQIFRAQNSKLQSPIVCASGWTHTEAIILQAAGDASISFAKALKDKIAPKLEGLLPRLESNDGKFLDIGVGVAALSIHMAHLWPSLHITGIDPWEPALSFARKNVQTTLLTQRIELRQQRVEDLNDSDTYDLVWLPSVFIPEAAVVSATARIVQALRPGGWLIFTAIRLDSEPLRSAVARLRTALFGGCLLASQDIEVLLRNAGFVQVHTLATPPNALFSMVAARRKL
jgi:2-polyprenyl-3-methyl-5-hydroxy-6-metoxy-1,4-benzoquinol methylase